MTTVPTSFNLIQQPWITVTTTDFQVKNVSLVELFETWEHLREIQAENPPTTLAIYRFLLAILHRAYQGPTDTNHWQEIVDDNGKKVIEYLQDKIDRFDLLHSESPFMQDLGISEEKTSECYSYLAYEMQGANTSTVFCHEHHWSSSSLSLAEAARLILRLQNFDFYGRKTGANERAGAIPMMNAANILVCGNNLKESILRNLMRYSPEDGIPSTVYGDDLPAWERKPDKAGVRRPNGYIDYLSYQWRRVRLFLDGDRVKRVASHAGDVLPQGISPETWEYGIAYKDHEKGRLPLQLNSNRSLWRDSSVLLQSTNTSDCPRILKWQAELIDEGFLPDTVHFQILGLQAEQASPAKHFSERFSIPAQFLSNDELFSALIKVINIADEHQEIFRTFQGSPYYELAQALSLPSSSKKVIGEKARKLAGSLAGDMRYWKTLDRDFLELLSKLTSDYQTGKDGVTRYGYQSIPSWTKIVQSSVANAFVESIASIRNYEARAKALHTLHGKLAYLRLTPIERAERKANDKKKKKENASA